MIKLELKRVFINKKMVNILILAFIITVCSSFCYLKDYIFFNYNAPDLQSAELQESAKKMVHSALNKYDVWLSSLNWYICMMPVISALPCALTYREDIESNMISNIDCRIKHSKYISSKIITNAISGGIIVTIPIIISFIISNIFFGGTLEDFSTTKGFGGSFNSVFINNYYKYILIHLGIEFLCGFSYSTIALAVSSKVKNSMAIILSPFLYWAGGSVIISFFNLPINVPTDINQFYMCEKLTLSEILVHLAFIFVAASATFIYYTRKDDIYEKRDII